MLEFFPTEPQLQAWAQALAELPAAAEPATTPEADQALDLRLRLAWGLRQRDSLRALALADDLAHELAAEPPGRTWPAERVAAAQVRLALLRGEALLLQGCIDEARAQLEAARALLRAGVDDALALSDLHGLGYYLAADCGDVPLLRAELQRAIACAAHAGEPQRQQLFEASLARAELFQDHAAAQSDWLPRLPAPGSELPPMVGAAVEDFHGMLAGMGAQYLSAIRSFSRAFDDALQTGQIRRAITLATNLGFTYTSMSDFQTAMEWLKRGLDLARTARWPHLISLCLAHTGEALRRLGQLADARELLQECLQLCAAQPGSRTHSLALSYLGHAELDAGQGEAALQAFETLRQQAEAAASMDLILQARLGLARAELARQRPAPARAHAEFCLGLAAAQQEYSLEVDALGLMAEIEEAEGGSQAGARALGWIESALQRAATLEGYAPPVRLLDAAARTFAEQGNYERAYHWALRAGELRQSSFSEEASRRSSAIHAHHQFERARAESEHLRRLAESEAARFQLLQDSHAVLLHLGEIGQEITNELEAGRVFEVMERHIHALLDAPSMAVYLLDASGSQLDCAFGMEGGETFRDPPIAMSDMQSLCARCVRERREFMLADAGSSPLGEPVPGTSLQRSMIFAPLQAAERVIGVMTIQSPRSGNYGEREQLIFRTLCSYIAVALDNARAYQRLGELQRQLMAQEKLAALGAMVAGVAHELNTPIGNSLLIASTLLGATRDFEARVAQAQLRRSDWHDYAGRARDGLQLIERSMESAAGLVNSFKQVAVDRASEQRRVFGLRELCEQCLQQLRRQAGESGPLLRLDLDGDIRMDAYPGPLARLLQILGENALRHAFEGRAPGLIEIGAQAQAEARVLIWLRDDGVGMSEAVQQRVFEPFFTTKFGQGGSGLGLSIAHNLATQLLGGRLGVSSQPGLGSRFVLDLPLQAP